MKNGKTIFLFITALLVIGLILVGEINFQSMATDSGFDTSYSGGSSGGSSGGHSHSGGSSSHSSSYSGSSIDNPKVAVPMFFIWELCFNSFFYYQLISLFYEFRSKENVRKKTKKAMISRGVILIVINILLICFNYELIMIPFTIDAFGIFILPFFTLCKPKYKNYSAMPDDKIREIIPNFDKEEFHFKAYQIYYEVQQAWMNFDYERMRTLVTDELYNSYYNQLQTLELKNEKNIMNGFELKSVFITNLKVENNIEEIAVQLTVSFFDYIEKENGVVVRGNKDRKVEMTYLLTFVRSHTSSDKCPHCGAKLENGETVCAYCHSNIQSVGSEMKLAKKEVLRQN